MELEIARELEELKNLKEQLSEREQQLIEAEEKLRLREERLLLSERVHATVVQATTDASRRASQLQQQQGGGGGGGKQRKSTLTRDLFRAVGRKGKDKDVKVIEKSQISDPVPGTFLHVQHVGARKGNGQEHAGVDGGLAGATVVPVGKPSLYPAAAPTAPSTPAAPSTAPNLPPSAREMACSTLVAAAQMPSPEGTLAAGAEAASMITAAAWATHSVRQNSPRKAAAAAAAVLTAAAASPTAPASTNHTPSILARIRKPLGITFRKEYGRFVVCKVKPAGNADLSGPSRAKTPLSNRESAREH